MVLIGIAYMNLLLLFSILYIKILQFNTIHWHCKYNLKSKGDNS